jgi:hypothetical protein
VIFIADSVAKDASEVVSEMNRKFQPFALQEKSKMGSARTKENLLNSLKAFGKEFKVTKKF